MARNTSVAAAVLLGMCSCAMTGASARASSEARTALEAAQAIIEALQRGDVDAVRGFVSDSGIECGGDGPTLEAKIVRAGLGDPASCIHMEVFNEVGYRNQCAKGRLRGQGSLAEVAAHADAWEMTEEGLPEWKERRAIIVWKHRASSRRVTVGFSLENGKWRIADDLFC